MTLHNDPNKNHARYPWTGVARMVTVHAALLVAACTGVEHAAQPVSPPGTEAPKETAAVAPVSTVQPPVNRATLQSPARTGPSDSKIPAKALPSRAAIQATDKKTDATKGAGRPVAAPTLDLAALEKRLRETEAIGVFTKITLKNQVDDLLNKFRAYYQGQARTSLAELRQPYDMLLLKVLSLLQDSDPGLARAIVASREAIWGILADPQKFATL
jgi:hypothetical protein